MTWKSQGVTALRIKKKVTAASDFISVPTLQFAGSETKEPTAIRWTSHLGIALLLLPAPPPLSQKHITYTQRTRFLTSPLMLPPTLGARREVLAVSG